MELYDTGAGDKWICIYCKPDLEQRIKDEGWRLVFEKMEPMLRCAECGQGEIEIDD